MTTPGPDERRAWLRLVATTGLGRVAARRLLAACGSAEAVLASPRSAIAGLVPARAAAALAEAPPGFDASVAALEEWLAGGADRHLLALGDAAYPPLLLETADPPLVLFVHGAVGVLSRPALAIVGSRSPTAQGADNAHAFAGALARAGYTIVSGLAAGIDAAAHEGALAAGAATVAVVGTGPDRVYPARHRDLAHRIVAGGALVSEFVPGTPPLERHFPQRNRIIAGLTLGTLVVEAALRSGSLITARQAAEAGREVFAIPGSIHSPQSRGCHALIKQGAKLVESAADVQDELRGEPAQRGAAAVASRSPAPSGAAGAAEDAAGEPTAAAPPDGDRGDDAAAPDALLDALGHDPISLDMLAARTGWPAATLAAKLLDLELAGRVARLPGGWYQRRGRA